MKKDRHDSIGEKIGMKNDGWDSIGEKIGMKNDGQDSIGEKIGMKNDRYASISEREKELLKYLSDNPSTSISKLADSMGMARSTVQIYLDKLRNNGIIKREGPDKGGQWVIIQ